MKKIVLILVILLLALTSCGKERVEDNSKKELRNKIIYMTGEKKAYTEIFIEKNKNGNKLIERKYKNGVIQESKLYYENNNLWSKVSYKDGKAISMKFYNIKGELISPNKIKNYFKAIGGDKKSFE
ncbi:MAG: toxin-antitoxin system YwqK family antitoxin [Fusobacterium ulcerans]|uniref:toxin-antitoxin system YwqK family antitoxin n=1 Tax=Fusobacterium ulcerans TaxID=861 RepID=UPI003A8B9382